MIKSFPIDYLRQIFEQTLLREHLKNKNYFGGKDQVFIASLYEQLVEGDDVDRYVDNVSDISEQQNRTSTILNGVITAPSNPTITNLYSCTIIPMEYVCTLRCEEKNNPQALETLNNLIEELKGSKVDVAELKCVSEKFGTSYVPFVVGTIGHNDGAPMLRDGDYVGRVVNANNTDDLIGVLRNKGITISEDLSWLYCEHENKLKVVNIVNEKGEDITDAVDTPVSHGTYLEVDVLLNDIYRDDQIYSIEAILTVWGEEESVTIPLDNGRVVSSRVVDDKTAILVIFELEKDIEEYVDNYVDFDLEEIIAYKKNTSYSFIVNDGTHPEIIFPPEHVNFEKYKVSISCEAMRCDPPFDLNGDKYNFLSFGGSATLQNASVIFGNDLVKVAIQKNKIIVSDNESQNIVFGDGATKYWVEPLEMPSGNNPSTKLMQLASNNFKTNSHTDGITPTLQYSFVVDKSIPLIKQWFNYARYGEIVVSESESLAMSPNLIYNVYEVWSSWGEVEIKKTPAKISDSADIDITEGDTMTIGIVLQIQGENN